MLAGAVPDLPVVNDLVQLCLAESLAELIEEDRKPMREFRIPRERGASQGDPRSGLRKDLLPIRCQELAEHDDNVRPTEPAARFGAR